jgi:membrane-associated phospholipid phosphatase
MRANVVIVAICEFLLISNTAAAQNDSVAHSPGGYVPPRAWIVPVGIVASYVIDPELREWVLHEHTHSLDRLAKSVNALGTGDRLIPAMAITYIGALLTRREALASGTLNAAAAYVASDLAESALKPLIGRERPHVAGNSHRFHPFTANGDWHSLPSAHVAHITAIAQAISMQTHSGSISALAGSLVALLGWDRIYEDQHWTSDVTATIALSSAVSIATIRWLESHWTRSQTPGESTR